MKEEIDRDIWLLDTYLLPGLVLNPGTQIWNVASLIVGIGCLALYATFIYKNDYSPTFDGLTDQELDDRVDDTKTEMLFGLLSPRRFSMAEIEHIPDLILVFKNPGFAENMRDQGEISSSAFKTILTQDNKRKDTFVATSKLLDDAEAAYKRAITPRRQSIADAFTGELVKVDKGEATKALLQDFYAMLPQVGFDSEIFRSMDDRLLYVCITLTQDEWVDLYLRREGWELPIQPQIVEEIGMGKCSDKYADAPPFIRYDLRTVKRFRELDIIDADDPRQLYAPHFDGGHTYCVSRTDRLRIVLKELSLTINLPAAKFDGLLEDWYPVHDMESLHRFGATWAAFTKFADFTFVQPIPRIEQYFGARVAFIFAWTGLYCKMLVPLAMLAMMWQSGALMLEYLLGESKSQRQILGFTLVVLVWSRMSANLWDREQEYFVKLFNLDNGSVQPAVRPEFMGELKPSTADSYVEDLHANPYHQAFRRGLSKFITVSSILFVIVCINLWFNMFEGRLNLLASLCLTIQIKIFELVYNKLSLVCNEFENHKYANDFYDSLLWKRFLFGFVNSYWAFFYIAVKQRFTTRGCRAGGCFVDLRNQLRMTLIILCLITVFMAVAQAAWVQASLWYHERKVSKGYKGPAMKRSFIEEQSNYIDFGLVEQINKMQTLTITLGYVILFGGIAPVIIPFCWAAFAVQLHACAFLLVTSTKQVVPEISFGVGAWRDVVNILMDVAVLFTGYLLAVYSATFAGAQLVTKMSGLILYCLFVCLMWRVVDFLCPTTSLTVRTLDKRRTRTKELLSDMAVESPGDKNGVDDAQLKRDMRMAPADRRASIERHGTDLLNKEGHGADDQMVRAGRWKDIPCVRSTILESDRPSSHRSQGGSSADGSSRIEKRNTVG